MDIRKGPDNLYTGRRKGPTIYNILYTNREKGLEIYEQMKGLTIYRWIEEGSDNLYTNRKLVSQSINDTRRVWQYIHRQKKLKTIVLIYLLALGRGTISCIF